MSNSTLDIVINYFSRGWMPIPLPHKSKNPNRKEWQKERFSREDLPRHFNNGQNVGLLLGEPSGGLIDVDLDCKEALSIADAILPATKMVSGRASAPKSHRWYVCDPIPPTTQFNDPSPVNRDDRSMMIEFRSTGGQTVVPPSIHPLGEAYEWYGELSPARVSGNDLLEAVSYLAACTLIARHWQNGQRQKTALALSGMLLRAGWEKERVENLIKLVVTAANDGEVDKRLDAVKSTYEAIQAGEKTTGAPSLADLIGDKVLACFRNWLALPMKSSGDSITNPTGERPPIGDAVECLRGLSADSSPEEIDSAIRQFASRLKSQDSLGREIAREAAVKLLKKSGCSRPARLIDGAISDDAQTSKQDETKHLELTNPEPWPDPVEGPALLDEVVMTIGRFISARVETLRVIALWIIYAHAFDAFYISPLLAITSPEKRCGKTTLLTLLRALVPRPLFTSNITPAALFRTIEKFEPTLLIDEADTFLTGDETLRGILNSGHHKTGAYIIRTSGDDYEPRQFSTWAPKAIAMIGNLPGTVADRAIETRMERKRASEEKEKLRLDRMDEFGPLLRRAARWAADNLDLLKVADPYVPERITNDRARDNWRVLFAIADAAGGDWPQFAREAACSMTGAESESDSVKTLLLRDLKTLFDERGDRLTSDEIIRTLIEIEGHPWGEWKNGKPLTKNGLARLLNPFGIRPVKWRDGDETSRGYERSHFDDVFDRYLEAEAPQPPQAEDSTTYSENQMPQPENSVAFADEGKPNEINNVAFVADEKPVIEERERFEL